MRESREEFRRRLNNEGIGEEEWQIFFEMMDLLKYALIYLRKLALYKEFINDNKIIKNNNFIDSNKDLIDVIENDEVKLIRKVGVSSLMHILRDIILFMKRFDVLCSFKFKCTQSHQLIIEKGLKIFGFVK